MATFENPALQTFAITSTIVGLQIVVLALWTGTQRVMAKKWLMPEDAKANKGELVKEEAPQVDRAKRAHYNLLENAIPFFVIGGMFVMTNPSRTMVLAYLWTFVVARLLHTLFYLAGKQPFRTLTFAVGVLVIIGMGVHVIRAALG